MFHSVVSLAGRNKGVSTLEDDLTIEEVVFGSKWFEQKINQ